MIAADLLQRERRETHIPARKYDKRYFPRWEVNKRVEYTEEHEAIFLFYTKDLTLNGACLIVFGEPFLDNYAKLKFHLTSKENFEAYSRIVWSMPASTYQLLGVCFENLSLKAEELIMHHAFKLSNNMK